MRRITLPTILLIALTSGISPSAESLFTATPLTPEGAFTSGIEGPACDRAGNIYAVSYNKNDTIGRIRPDGSGEVYITMPTGSRANGIRFDRRGNMYVADHMGHNVFLVRTGTRRVEVLAHDGSMNQPNDLALAKSGDLYASDPDWKTGTGQVWRVTKKGKIEKVAPGMGTTNGIEVDPSGRVLYVNETNQRTIQAFRIGKHGELLDKRLFIEFKDFGMDGMRCDVDGNLYVTRHGKGTVAEISSSGKVLREIDVLGKLPSNLCFGGPDGRTCYVTEVEHRRIVSFRVDRPGLEWLRTH